MTVSTEKYYSSSHDTKEIPSKIVTIIRILYHSCQGQAIYTKQAQSRKHTLPVPIFSLYQLDHEECSKSESGIWQSFWNMLSDLHYVDDIYLWAYHHSDMQALAMELASIAALF